MGAVVLEKWEYLSTRVEVSSGGFLDILYDNKLNELGQQGWELVSFFITNGKPGYSSAVISVLKRRI